MILEFLQFEFFRKGLERAGFICKIRDIIEKDWDISDEYENKLRNIMIEENANDNEENINIDNDINYKIEYESKNGIDFDYNKNNSEFD